MTKLLLKVLAKSKNLKLHKMKCLEITPQNLDLFLRSGQGPQGYTLLNDNDPILGNLVLSSSTVTNFC